MTSPLEHDYIGLSELPSMDAGENFAGTEEDTLGDLKKTKLRLGLPGSESPERENWNASVLMLGPPKSGGAAVSGSKRDFSAAIRGGGNQWLLHGGGVGCQTSPKEDDKKGRAPLSAKAQVVGWPPIRNYRKNTLSANAPKNQNTAAEENKQEVGFVYVKVSMDGAPYLRKVDLKNYCNYEELSSSLEKMFSCFTIGQCGNGGAEAGKSEINKSRLIDLLDGSEYVLTYEDKDGDWMLVGDVPWDMFTATCKRLRIMKGSEAIGLAPRAAEKNKNHN